MTIARKLWATIGYEPHEKQLEAHESDARFKVLVCGRRWGKSRWAAAEVEPKVMTPNTRGWIVGPEYKVGEKEFRYLWDDLIVKLRLGSQMKRKAYNVRTGEMYIETPWGSRVDVMSADHPDSLVGEGLDWVIISEAAKQNPQVWEKYLRPALADKHGTAIFPSTPEGFNWFYERYREGQGTSEDWESWRYPSWENPYVYPGGFDDPEVQSQLRTPDDPWFWQEIGADFRSVVGLVYPEWDDRINVRRHEYRADWTNELWMDFGFTNPTVALDVQISPSNDIHIWREYYVRQEAASITANNLKMRHNPDEYRLDAAYGDAAGPNWCEEIGMRLIRVVAMEEAKDWQRGVQEVKRFLKDIEGRPHLFVDPACQMTINEFNGYKIKSPQKKDPRMNLREEPEKKDDHCMDAIRYGIMHRFVLGASSHVTSDMFGDRAETPQEDELMALVAPGIFTRDMAI